MVGDGCVSLVNSSSTSVSTAYGIIYIELIDYFQTTRKTVAGIGSLSSGLTFLAGTLLAFSGCFISWFASGIFYLYVSYGIILGFGFGLILVPCNLIVVQYFKGRIGLANAVGSIGSGLATFILPPLYNFLLEGYGWKGALLILSGIILNGLVCAALFKPPFSVESATKKVPSKTKHLMSCKKPAYICRADVMLNMAATSQGLFGCIVPFVHLPDFAVQMDLDKSRAANLISIMGASGIAGRVVFGWISDFRCVSAIFLQGFSPLVCGAVTAVCPHLTEFYALAAYSVVYGLFIGVFVSMIPVALFMLVGLDNFGSAFGIAMFPGGISETAASPLAGFLFDTTQTYSLSFYVTDCFVHPSWRVGHCGDGSL